MQKHSQPAESASGRPEREEFKPGQRFRDYRVLESLAYGFLGGIYRLKHFRTREESCVAVLPEVTQEIPGFSARLDAYLKQLEAVAHPNVLQVRNHEAVGPWHCLFLEQVEGVNLNDHLRNSLESRQGIELSSGGTLPYRGLPPAEVQDTLNQTAKALQASHQAGINHHLLNPASLIRTPEGRIKVFGIGLLEALGDELFERMVSVGVPPIRLGPATIEMTPLDVLSPEKRLRKSADHRSDIYALGQTGYFLLTSHKATSERTSLSECIPDINPAWDRFIDRCLQTEPRDRYASMNTVLGELRKLEAPDPRERIQNAPSGKETQAGSERRNASDPLGLDEFDSLEEEDDGPVRPAKPRLRIKSQLEEPESTHPASPAGSLGGGIASLDPAADPAEEIAAGDQETGERQAGNPQAAVASAKGERSAGGAEGGARRTFDPNRVEPIATPPSGMPASPAKLTTQPPGGGVRSPRTGTTERPTTVPAVREPEEVEAEKRRKSAGRKRRGRGKESGNTLSASARRRTLRLALLGTAVVLAAAFTLYFLRPQWLGLAPSEVAPVRMTTGEEYDLLINTFPRRATVSFGPEFDFPVYEGEIRLDLPRGEYTVTVTGTGYFSKTKTLEVRGEGQEAAFILDPAPAELTVAGAPGVRAVAIDSQGNTLNLGETDADGLLSSGDKLLEGAYTIELSQLGFRTLRWEDVALKHGQPLRRNFALEKIPASLQVLAEPMGATVLIDGHAVGRTPLVIEDFPENRQFEVAVRMPGYIETRRSIEVGTGDQSELDFGLLEPSYAFLLFEVTLDGRRPTPQERAALEVSVGDRILTGLRDDAIKVRTLPQPITVRHPDYMAWNQRIDLEDGEQRTLRVDLEPKPARLFIETSPPRYFELWVNARPIRPEEDGSYILPANEPMSMELRVRDYLTARRELTLEPNAKQSWEAGLVPVPAPTAGENFVVPYLGMQLNWIPPGSFNLGSPPDEAERLPVEGPQTWTRIRQGYWIGRYEVTQQEYRTITRASPSRFEGDRHPVENVTWDEAMRFAESLTKFERVRGRLPEGYTYRLPTEAEWEYACRAGTTGPYHFGVTEVTPEHGNFKGTYPRRFGELPDSPVYGTRQVGRYAANDLGLHDMHGNVREWCLDQFQSRFPGGQADDFLGRSSDGSRTYRGGGWEDLAGHCRSASRDRLSGDTRSASVGFRLVLAPERSVPGRQ